MKRYRMYGSVSPLTTLLFVMTSAFGLVIGCSTNSSDKSWLSFLTPSKKETPKTSKKNADELFIPGIASRGWDESIVYFDNVGVEHETLYLVGPYESKGGDNVYDQMTMEDMAAAFVAPAAYLGNVAALPLSIAKDSPFANGVSRGGLEFAEPGFEMPSVYQYQDYEK